MTFEYWLNKFKKNDLPACDLLEDYRCMCKIAKLIGEKKPKLTLQHLYDNHACDAAIDTFNRLYALYADDMIRLKRGGAY